MAKSAVLDPVPAKSETVSCSSVKFSELREPPWGNPREKPTPESVRDLARTIEVYGLLHPLVVLPCADGKGYHLLAGFRRRAALELLGRTAATAHVLREVSSMEPAELARRVQIVENGQRQELDPIRESEVVAFLLEGEHATVESVALDLGRSTSWVLSRSKLTTLCKEAKAARKKGGAIEHWPTAWLEQLAYMTPADQAGLVALQKDTYTKVASLGELRSIVRQRLQALSAAPWKLDEENVAPGVTSCVKCPKHTAANQELFQDEGAKDVKTARCLDGDCFAKKREAWTERAIATAKAKHGADLELVAGAARPDRRTYGDPDDDRAYDVINDLEQTSRQDAGKGKKAAAPLEERRALHEFREVKKTEKGAIPVLVVEGVDAGKVKYVKERPKGSSGVVSSDGRVKPKAKPLTMAEKQAALAKRRHKHVLLAIEEQIVEWGDDPKRFPAKLIAQAASDPQWLLDVVAVFGCADGEQSGYTMNECVDAKKAARILRDGGVKVDGNKGLLPRILDEFTKSKMEGLRFARDVSGHYEWARLLWVEAFDLEQEWKALVTAAETEIPTPRGWAEEAKPAAKGAKKKTAAKKGSGKGTLEKLEAKLTDLRQALKKPVKKGGKVSGKDAAAGERDELGDDEEDD